MATIWSLVTAAFVVLVATTVVPAASQEAAEMAQEGVPNQMEPLNRKARQFWKPPTYNPPGTFPGARSRWGLGIGVGGGLGGGLGINIGGLGIGASAGASAGLGIGIGAGRLGGGGFGQEAWACGILCPDDDEGFIPYRAPRPTKGSFVPIRG